MKWFQETKKTGKELQDELKALCDKCIAQQYMSSYDENRYEKLLRNIYARNLEPCIKLIPKKK